MVRVTHWITVLSFFALLFSGTLLVFSHPRFYWGETGNVNTHPLFTIPIPSSRDTVPTGYGYVMPDQNGWSRDLHFRQHGSSVLTGLVYVIASLWNGHFRNNYFRRGARGRGGRSGLCSRGIFGARRRMRRKPLVQCGSADRVPGCDLRAVSRW